MIADPIITASRADAPDTYDLIITDGIVRMIIRCECEDKFMALATALETADITFESVY
jgi:hypothetical protein